jgi:hypothetical protein
MPGYKSIARQLTRNFSLPPTDGSGYNWPLAEVMRGLWEEATSNAANNIAETDAMEAAFVAAYSQVPTAIRDRSIEYGRAVGAAVFAGSLNDGGHQGYLTNFHRTRRRSDPGCGFRFRDRRHCSRTGASTSSRL